MAENQCATSRYAFIINGGAVSWSAKKQELVTLSTTESEYVGAVHATKEALWLRFLISQIFHPTRHHHPLLWQPVCHCTCYWSSISSSHQAYWFVLSFHLLGCWRRSNSTYILSHYEHGRWHIYKGTPISQSQAFCKCTWSRYSLRGSVGKYKHAPSHCTVPCLLCVTL